MPLSDVATTKRSDLTALLLIAPAPSIGVLAAMFIWPGTALGQTVFVICKVWLLAMPLAWRLLIQRRPPSGSPARRGGFVTAALLGLAMGGAIVGGYLLLGQRLIDVHALRPVAAEIGLDEPALYLGLAVYWIAVNSVLEEYVYRWFIYRRCRGLMPATAAVLLAALLFTVHHTLALAAQFDWMVTLLGSIGVFIGGAVWSWCYMRYQSIWPGYLSHAIVDVAVFWVGWRVLFG